MGYSSMLIVVSILVLLDFPFGPVVVVSIPEVVDVSILVLLDFPFGLYRLALNRLCCFTTQVSILVLLDFPFGLYYMMFCTFTSLQFQSLFCWIFLLDLLISSA